MFRVSKPGTMGYLAPDEKFQFEGDTDIYYFIGNYGVSGYVSWNDTKKVRKVIQIRSTTTMDKIKVKIID